MKYLCLIIFFFANYLYAQQKFEVYVVNDNYYIVDLETETAASDFFEVEKIVLENYTIIEDVPKVRDEVFVKEVLFEKKSKSMKINKQVSFMIGSNDIFDWTFYDSDNTLFLYNYDRSEYYIFKVDFENKRFLIPTELREKIGLRFE